MEKEANKESLKRLIDEVWNLGNFDTVEELIAPAYTVHHDPGDPWEGKTLNWEQYKQRVLYSRNAFPDLNFDIKEFVTTEDRVVISWILTGTHLGDLAEVPASGKQINISGLTIYYFEDDKISGHWQVIDQLAFVAQIGMFGSMQL